jgi:hypothetical protein
MLYTHVCTHALASPAYMMLLPAYMMLLPAYIHAYTHAYIHLDALACVHAPSARVPARVRKIG